MYPITHLADADKILYGDLHWFSFQVILINLQEHHYCIIERTFTNLLHTDIMKIFVATFWFENIYSAPLPYQYLI
jgi:hypothetical protein